MANTGTRSRLGGAPAINGRAITAKCHPPTPGLYQTPLLHIELTYDMLGTRPKWDIFDEKLKRLMKSNGRIKDHRWAGTAHKLLYLDLHRYQGPNGDLISVRSPEPQYRERQPSQHGSSDQNNDSVYLNSPEPQHHQQQPSQRQPSEQGYSDGSSEECKSSEEVTCFQRSIHIQEICLMLKEAKESFQRQGMQNSSDGDLDDKPPELDSDNEGSWSSTVPEASTAINEQRTPWRREVKEFTDKAVEELFCTSDHNLNQAWTTLAE